MKTLDKDNKLLLTYWMVKIMLALIALWILTACAETGPMVNPCEYVANEATKFRVAYKVLPCFDLAAQRVVRAV